MRLNHTAQVRTVDLALPLLPPGGRIVFVTSHYAHHSGTRSVLAEYEYESVVRSKKAGEDALRARISELADHSVSLIVVSGDLIEGTITAILLDRAWPGLLQARRQQAGALPAVAQFAAAATNATTNQALHSGATIFVGSTGC